MTRFPLAQFLHAQSRQGEPAALLQHILVNEVVDVVATSLALHQPSGSQHPQVLGNSRLGHSQKSRQGVDAERIWVPLAAEQLHQLEAGRVSQRTKDHCLLINTFRAR